MNKEILKKLEKQINKEFYSAFLYLAMSEYLNKEGFEGMANWMYQQYKEEEFHAIKIINYVHARGDSVEILAIEAPKTKYKSIMEVFEDSLEHEKSITKSINDLYKLAVKKEDFATQSLLRWYVDEQVEEEDNVDKIINQLKLIGDNNHGLLMLDKELKSRTFDNAGE